LPYETDFAQEVVWNLGPRLNHLVAGTRKACLFTLAAAKFLPHTTSPAT